MISESKQENSFPNEEFLIEGYGAPFSLDQNKLGRDIILFFRSDIPAKLLLVDICFESFFVNLSFWKKKRILNCPYNPKSSNIELHLNCLSMSRDVHLSKYGNIILLDFISWMLSSSMKAFVKLSNSVVLWTKLPASETQRFHHAST